MQASVVVEDTVDTIIVLQTNCVLFLLCCSFVMYLMVPRGVRKHVCNVYPKRFAKTYFVQHEVPTQITTSREQDYDFINTCSDDGYHNSFTPTPRRSKKKPTRGWVAPSPLILDPEKACVMTGQLFTGQQQPADTTASSCDDSSPARLFTPGGTARKHNIRNPLHSTIDEEAGSQSPNSVMDQSMCSDTKKLLVLISTRNLDKQQLQDQKEALALLRQRKVPYDTVDGMNSLQRSRREELCCLSGTRAQYPQFFFVHADGLTTYLGDYKMLQKIHHAEGLPRSYRDANPDVSTWYQVFCDTSQIFSV